MEGVTAQDSPSPPQVPQPRALKLDAVPQYQGSVSSVPILLLMPAAQSGNKAKRPPWPPPKERARDSEITGQGAKKCFSHTENPLTRNGGR